MNCFQIFVKYCLLIFNLFVLICGFIILIFGLLDKFDLVTFRKLLPAGYQALALSPILIISIGCLAIIVALFGFLGAKLESVCLLIVYVILLCIILLVQIAVAITLLIMLNNKSLLERNAQSTMKPMFDTYSSDKSGSSRGLVDFLQRELKCCGMDGPAYWTASQQTVPDSCKDPSTKTPYADGCSKQFSSSFSELSKKLGILLLVFALIEIICLIAAIYLIKVFRRQRCYATCNQY